MRLLLPLSFCLLFAACSFTGEPTNSAPIVMGDSSTIVTETDPKYLKSTFSDFSSDVKEETAPAPTPETPQPEAPAAEKKSQNADGLSADFGGMQVFIANLRVRNSGADGKGKSSLSYSSDGSVFNPKNIVVAGATRASVKQKTDYQISLNAGSETLPLSTMGQQSTGWQSLSGSGENFNVAALQNPTLRLNNAALTNAAQQALRKANVDRKVQKEILRRLNGVTKTDGDLLVAKPVATLWQITAKDAKGRPEIKEIRVDWER